MMRLTTVLTIVVGAVCLTLVPQASGQTCTGRPGASAIEQYCEAIPSATGDRVTPGRRQSSSSSSEGTGVSSTTARRLESSGAEGQALMGLIASEQDNAVGANAQRAVGDEAGASDSIPAASGPSNNPLKAVSSAVSNGATVGSTFLWVMIGLGVAALAGSWMNFRRQHTGEE